LKKHQNQKSLLVTELNKTRAKGESLLSSFTLDDFVEIGNLSSKIFNDREVQNLIYIFIVTLNLDVSSLKFIKDFFTLKNY